MLKINAILILCLNIPICIYGAYRYVKQVYFSFLLFINIILTIYIRLSLLQLCTVKSKY
jgi:hypothetical protein